MYAYILFIILVLCTSSFIDDVENYERLNLYSYRLLRIIRNYHSVIVHYVAISIIIRLKEKYFQKCCLILLSFAIDAHTVISCTKYIVSSHL